VKGQRKNEIDSKKGGSEGVLGGFKKNIKCIGRRPKLD